MARKAEFVRKTNQMETQVLRKAYSRMFFLDIEIGESRGTTKAGKW